MTVAELRVDTVDGWGSVTNPTAESVASAVIRWLANDPGQFSFGNRAGSREMTVPFRDITAMTITR